LGKKTTYYNILKKEKHKQKRISKFQKCFTTFSQQEIGSRRLQPALFIAPKGMLLPILAKV